MEIMANQLVYALQADDGDNIITEMRTTDGYVNATKLCKSADKVWNKYYRNKRTQSFLAELAQGGRIRSSDLVQIPVVGSHSGTWVHPDVAIDLAAWCSAKFQVAVAKLVRRYLSGEITTHESKTAKQLVESHIIVSNYEGKEVVYLAEVTAENFHGVKIGSTDKLIERIETHSHDFDSFKIVKVFENIDNRKAERALLTSLKALGRRTNCIVKTRKQTELVKLDDQFTLDNLLSLAEKIVNNTVHPLIEQHQREIQDIKQLNEIERFNLHLQVLQKEHENMKLEYQTRVNKLESDVKYLQDVMEQQSKQIANMVVTREVQLNQESANDVITTVEEQSNVSPIPIINSNDSIDDSANDDTQEMTPMIEVKNYVDKICERGVDTKDDRYRIILNDLYAHYVESVKYALPMDGFKNYLTGLKLPIKNGNWYHKTELTVFNIRLPKYMSRKQQLIVTLIEDFVKNECITGNTFVEDTAILYDAFEKYSSEKGFETLKLNGFSRQNFRTEILRVMPFVSVKEWAIEGKRHGFAGLKLKSTPRTLHEAIDDFAAKQCMFGLGFRIKSIDLWSAFAEYQSSQEHEYSRVNFYRVFKEKYPQLICKYVTKCDKGFVGVTLKSVLDKKQP